MAKNDGGHFEIMVVKEMGEMQDNCMSRHNPYLYSLSLLSRYEQRWDTLIQYSPNLFINVQQWIKRGEMKRERSWN